LNSNKRTIAYYRSQAQLFLFFVFAAIPFCGFSQVTIEGTIRNYDGKSLVYYTHTWDGIHTMNQKSLKPKNNGKFKIEFNNDGFGNIKIGYQRKYRLFFDKKSKIYIEIDNDKKDFISVEGDFQEINEFYNPNERILFGSLISVSGNKHSRLIADLESPELVLSALDSLIQREVNKINNLNIKFDLETAESKIIDLEIKEFLINEVQAYYGNVFLNAMLLKKMAQQRKVYEDSSISLLIYNKKWQDMIESFSDYLYLNMEPIANSSDYNEMVRILKYTVDSYKQLDFNQPKTIDEDVYNKLLRPDSLLFNDSSTVIAYRLNYLHIFLNSDIFYSPVLLDAVYQLQDQYPDLSHWDLLNPLIEKLQNSIHAAGKEFKKAKILKTNYVTFNDLIAQFKGNNIFIDIWATWCGPCVKDFQYKDVILPFVESQQLEWLYISIDKPQWEDRWRQSIKYNELEGYHVRANNELVIDMWNTLGGVTGAIPRYVLVDKNGNIFLSTAARPSDGELLKEQIKSLLSTK